MGSRRSIILGAIPIIVILVIWQILSTENIISPIILPPVSKIALRLYYLLVGGDAQYDIPTNFLFTMERMTLGDFLASALVIPLGILIGSNKQVFRLLEPTIEIFRPMPSVALIPVFMLLLGVNLQMYVCFVAYGCAWPILINTIDGTRSVEPLFYDVARSFKKGARRIIFRITLPAVSPYVVSGLRVSTLLSLLLTIVIEMVSGFDGLGWSTIYAQQVSDITTLYAEIFFIAIIGLGLNFLFATLENRIMKWHKRFTRV